MKKRIVSIVLCLCALMSLFVLPASATEAGLANFTKSQTYTVGQYADVPATNTFSENVKAGYEYGIMQGYGTTFGVNNSITRLASIIIACRLNSIYFTGANNIADTYTGTTQEIHLQYAMDHDILCDFDDVSKSATRAEFAAILSSALPDKALVSFNTVEDNAIPDVKSGHMYYTDIYRLYRAGIINGSDKKGTFYPDSNITRGAACAIATRMCDEALRKSVTLVNNVVPENENNSSSSGTSSSGSGSSGSGSSGVTVPTHPETEGHLVWVPVNGGTKYHSKSTCSKMKNPIQVSIETAIANGYTACGRCY